MGHRHRGWRGAVPSARLLPHETATGILPGLQKGDKTLETCVFPDGTEKRGWEVTFKESTEGGDQVPPVRRRGTVVLKGLLRRYRTLRSLGVGRIASMRAAWRVDFGRVPDDGEWP